MSDDQAPAAAEAPTPPPIPVRAYQSRIRFKLSADAPSLAIGLPMRRLSPPEFMVSMLQMLPPLNVRMTYLIQKGADALGGKLGAEARNAILQQAIESGIQYVIFFDDDVLFPDMAAYRLWVNMQRRPEAGAISGVYVTKTDPCEPLLYKDDLSGAYWDWPLGGLFPIHSAGAGVQIVNIQKVAELAPPWFNDVIVDAGLDSLGLMKRHTWGHDRFFHIRLREEAKAPVYVDTGLLCAHWDVEAQRAYMVPPDAPCFQRKAVGESFVPFVEASGAINWTRFLPPPDTAEWQGFRGYLDWKRQQEGNPDTSTKLQLVS